jgi:glycosyltransferase involved in cell wall biosynthesis
MPGAQKIDAMLRAMADGSYYRALIHSPSPQSDRQPPVLVFQEAFALSQAIQTIVTPMFNQADTIARSIQCIVRCITAPTDFIFIDDCSEDSTVGHTIDAIRKSANARLVNVTVLRNPVPIYETACDNIGFTLAETGFIIELQADIDVEEPGFDEAFRRIVSSSLVPSAISGRCGHTFELLLNRGDVVRNRSPMVGLCGANVETPQSVESLRGMLFQCETVNRGPWLLLKQDLERHGYLDEKNFFLGNDDHDYHRRLYQTEARRPLYLPMRIVSPVARGATRRSRTGRNLDIFNHLSAEKRGSPEFWRYIQTYRPIQYPTPIKV